jgi:anti-sigma-K factor RskA
MERGVGRYRIKAARIAKGILQIEERNRAQQRIHGDADFAIRRHQLLVSHRLFLFSHLAIKAN